MKQFNILIIDDDPDDHNFIKAAISEFGMRINVISVFDGLQGVKYLGLSEFNSVPKTLPDLIICDINMPFMNGIDFVEKLKGIEYCKNIPVFILSTSCDEETKKKLIALGALDCLIKPVYVSNYKILLADIFNKVPFFDDLR